MSVKEWFINVWTKGTTALSRFFEGPGGAIVRQALGAVVEQAGTIGMSMLLDAAKGQVGLLNQTTLTNDSKRIQALDYLKGYAVKAGIEASESLLRYTLETAVTAVKGDAGRAP